MPPRPTASSRRRCSMARRRASMREGPLAELFRATEAAQRQAEKGEVDAPDEAKPRAQVKEPQEETVEHVPDFARPREEPTRTPVAAAPEAVPEPTPEPEPEPMKLEPVP